MNRSESIKELATALAKAQGEIENPTKNAANPHFKSRYADLAEILNTARPVLAANGICVVQIPEYVDGFVSVETTLFHTSGEWLSGVTGAPVGKADPQGVGSACTYLRRYSLAAMCGIAQEDDDGEAGSRPARENGAHHEKAETPAPPAFSLDDALRVGKHKGKTWRQLLDGEKGYIRWALENMETLSTEAKLALRDALTPPPTPEPTPAQLALELTEVLENARVLGFLTDEQDARCQVALDSMDEGDLRRTLDWLATRMEAHKLQPVRQPVERPDVDDLFGELAAAQLAGR